MSCDLHPRSFWSGCSGIFASRRKHAREKSARIAPQFFARDELVHGLLREFAFAIGIEQGVFQVAEREDYDEPAQLFRLSRDYIFVYEQL